jgi:hypothetical protein
MPLLRHGHRSFRRSARSRDRMAVRSTSMPSLRSSSSRHCWTRVSRPSARTSSSGRGIPSDMFQELLLADLVVAELSIDNPNAWYELGVRHALRARGVIPMFSGRDYLPFDVGPERALGYALKAGKPAPAHLKDDRKRLAEMAQATLAAWRGRRISRVYHLLPNLSEPDWRTLRLGDVNEYREKLDDWLRRVAIAVKNSRPGDVLVLAEEPPTFLRSS